MRKLAFLFAALAVVMSDIMCAVVAYSYRGLQCGIEHAGFSAPAWFAFLYAVPFAVVIAACTVLAILFYKKSK